LQRVKTERDEAVKLLRSLRSNIAVADFPVPDWNLLDRTDDFLSRYDYRMTTMKPDLAAELALVVQRAENAEKEARDEIDRLSGYAEDETDGKSGLTTWPLLDRIDAHLARKP
jgi:hypothetical protein